ncbi:hypothetical protein A4A49_34453 [Nicotiana attenuata]|uniref:Replication protein a 70 kDa dna-binding subunit b n=1 Tax=Nicotiana attenuata TaxID=49451 RepID=A0A1J6KTJ7_NICAT|nr:hypothetical protein A4A49_34453 [Nicotiana attenuata]
MEQRYTIHEITSFTRVCTCKIQVVDKIRPKISRDERVHFQTTIVQDENEDQICIITYGPEVPHYENLFKHFHTYLISAAKVREPSHFAIPMHTFEWVVDTFSIVEEVTENSEEESMLPLPTRLNMVSFVDIEKQIPGDEFDLVAVVANCGTMKYQGSENRRFQEAILIDDKKKPFHFTIWGELADNDGAELLQQLHRYPVIVAKRIAVSNFKQETDCLRPGKSSTSAVIAEGSKRKLESISTSEADRSPSTEDENPRKKPNVQSTTPLQK